MIRIVCCTLWALSLAAGCQTAPAPPNAAALVEARRRSPSQTIRQIVDAYQEGRYADVAVLTLPERATAVVSTLKAVHEFKAANGRLVEFVRARLGAEPANTLDCSAWVDRLDIFSRFIELVNERIEGGVATVAFMANGELPLKYATLRSRDHVWLYDCGEGYHQRLPEAFLMMARAMDSLVDDLGAGKVPAEHPALLAEELARRMAPAAALLAPPASQPRDSDHP